MTRTEKQRMRDDSEAILDSWYERLAFVEANRPDSIPTAQLGLSDAQRVRQLCHGKRITLKHRMEITARLVRANLLSDALNGDVQ